MQEQPISCKDYSPLEQEFRGKEDTSKMLGDALIRTKSYVNEKERIKVSNSLWLIPY